MDSLGQATSQIKLLSVLNRKTIPSLRYRYNNDLASEVVIFPVPQKASPVAAPRGGSSGGGGAAAARRRGWPAV